MVECDCQQHKNFVDENHDYILMGDFRIITNSELRKLESKGPNFLEAISINWNKIKIEIDSSIERIIKQTPN